jgi:acyl-CoA reductase-like NAD-dependent aldehyde dehydrogenase
VQRMRYDWLNPKVALNPKSTMGSVISHASLERLVTAVNRSTRKVLIGGERMTSTSALDGFDFSKGSFYAPTVVEDVGVEDELWQEELFGPVLVVAKFKVSFRLYLIIGT